MLDEKYYIQNIIIPNLPNADKYPVSLGPGSPFIRGNQIPYHVLLTAKRIQRFINLSNIGLQILICIAVNSGKNSKEIYTLQTIWNMLIIRDHYMKEKKCHLHLLW